MNRPQFSEFGASHFRNMPCGEHTRPGMPFPLVAKTAEPVWTPKTLRVLGDLCVSNSLQHRRPTMIAFEISLKSIACIALVDFLSGFFHWLEDAYGHPDWPI